MKVQLMQSEGAFKQETTIFQLEPEIVFHLYRILKSQNACRGINRLTGILSETTLRGIL